MEKNILGNTGIEVSILAIGTLTMSPMQRGLSLEEGREVILHALSSGINFIDTAQMYGSYPQVRAALHKWMGNMPVIASKSAVKNLEEMENAIAECQEGLHLKTIDIFLLHAVRDMEDFNSRQGALEALIKAKEKGIIKAIGLSSHSANTINAAAENKYMEILHPMLNRDGIGILDAPLEKMIEFLQTARANGKGIYAMKPLGGGHLRQDAAEALRWLWNSKHVDSAAAGMTTYEEIDMNVALASNKPIDRAFAEKVAGQPRELFINKMVCKNCGACIAACQQGALKPGANSPEINHTRCVLCGYCSPECPSFAIRII
ncbi:MAG: aldo/keto reductase [Candidatus Rifleibacteriota bacterium]